MRRVDPRQREVLIEKMLDTANLAAGSVFLGQFLTERPFSMAPAVAGVALWIACWAFTLVLSASSLWSTGSDLKRIDSYATAPRSVFPNPEPRTPNPEPRTEPEHEPSTENQEA